MPSPSADFLPTLAGRPRPPAPLPLVALDGVNVAFEGRTVLRDITWQLRPGEHWAVLGGNGSGKSTFLRLVRGELWPAPGPAGRRVYAFDGDAQTSAVGIKERIAIVSPELQQRYLAQEWSLTGLQVVQSGFGGGDYVYQRLTRGQHAHAGRIIETLGLGPFLQRNVQALSTGELRKLLIARALAGAPRVLACDEICDGLDAASRDSILGVLEQLARGGTLILCATHRAEEIIPSIQHCLELEQGRARAGRKSRFQTRIAAAGHKPRRRQPSDAPPTPNGRTSSLPRTLIRIEQADVYLGNKQILRDLDWELRAGQHWAIVGPNGSGKSTFLKLLAGDLHPAWGGGIRWFGWPPGHGLWKLRRRIGFISPELQAGYREDAPGRDIVASGFFSSIGLRRSLTRNQRAKVRDLIEKLGLRRLADKSAARMSYGEFRLVLLARALVHDPDMLLCDEPFDGLDAAARRRMQSVLEQAASRGTTLVIVTHHLGDLPSCITHTARLKAGRLVARNS